MQSFPLIRTKLSNERLMSALLLVLALYNLPRWQATPGDLGPALLLLVYGLAIDAAAGLIQYHRPVCAVSAGVTVLLLYTLSPGAPVWAEFLAIAAALLAGKHLWGGTGKNPVNPAMVGLLLLGLIFPLDMPVFMPTWLLLPAVLLSLPFLLFRPFAALGMIGGMAAALLLRQELTLATMIANGVVLWSCLVITDPVTITAKPRAGVLIGALAGFVPLFIGGSAVTMALGVLTANGLSMAADRLGSGTGPAIRLRFGRRQRIAFSPVITSYRNLADDVTAHSPDASLSGAEILQRITDHQVFGCGGAAFPTARKILAVIGAPNSARHLIVNGVECDPGLLHDKWLLAHQAAEIMQGIELLGRCLPLPFATVTIAVKDTAGLAFPAPVQLHRTPDFYPAGAERLLIREVLHRKLADTAIPAAEGILVLNVNTIFAIYEAVGLNHQIDTRLITVAATGKLTGSVLRVRLGSKVQDIVNEVLPGAATAFIGGGLMNARIAASDAVVDETVNLIAVGRFPRYRESPLCSSCGLCAAVCPARLPVQKIARLVDEDRLDQAVLCHPEMCLSCGSCSYVCLAGRNLAARVSTARNAGSPR